MFNSIGRDLVQAGRRLAKARSFTFVCVISLGIGMAPVIAIPYLSRVLATRPPGVKTEGLVEILTTPMGTREATDIWSYPDYADLRDADTGMTLVGWTYGQSEGPEAPLRSMFVSTNYFQAIGVALFRGAKRLIFGNNEKARQTLTIVGVIGDFPTAQMATRREQLLLPLAQHPSQELFLIARSRPGESAQKLAATLEKAARDFDPNNRGFGVAEDGSPAYPKVVTGAWLRKRSVDDFLTGSAVAGIAGSVILLLSALGIYGVVGLMVATRTRELAVRMALGASPRRVLGMVLFDVVKLVLPGVVVGVILRAAFIRVNGDNMGISLSNAEPVAYLAGAVIAVVVAVLASLTHARRAASVQPMVAMRAT